MCSSIQLSKANFLDYIDFFLGHINTLTFKEDFLHF